MDQYPIYKTNQEAYRKHIVDHVMLNVKGLASLQARWSMQWKAHFEKFFQLMRINRVSVASIFVETNKNHIHFERNLKRNLQNKHHT